MDELSIDVAAHSHYACGNNVVWNCRVVLILLNKVQVDLVNMVFTDCFDKKSVALIVAEGAQ